MRRRDLARTLHPTDWLGASNRLFTRRAPVAGCDGAAYTATFSVDTSRW